MLHYFQVFIALHYILLSRNEQMGCRNEQIIPTPLQLFVWRANAKLCILSKKKKKEGRSCCWGRDPFVRWFRPIPPAGWNPLTGSHPVWVSSKRWGGGIWLQWNNKCRLQEAFYFLRVPLAETAPIWRWMYHTLFLQRKLSNLGEKRTSEKAKRTKDALERKDLIGFGVSDRRAGILGVDMGVHKDSQPSIWCWGGGPWNQH